MPHLATYLGLLHRSEQTLADSFLAVGKGHAQEPDVFHLCRLLAQMSRDHERRLEPIAARYGEQGSADDVDEPERLHAAGVAEVRTGGIGLLRDLQDLYLLGTLVSTSWTMVSQAAQGARDGDLLAVAEHCGAETARQLTWLESRMKSAAPQALLVSS